MFFAVAIPEHSPDASSLLRYAMSAALTQPAPWRRRDNSRSSRLVVDDAEVSGDKLVLQARAIGDHDLVALVGDDDARSGESHALAEPHISGNGQVVQLGNVRDRLESLLEVLPVSIEFCSSQSMSLTATFLNWSPSLTTGVPPNSRLLSMLSTPCSRL